MLSLFKKIKQIKELENQVFQLERDNDIKSSVIAHLQSELSTVRVDLWEDKRRKQPIATTADGSAIYTKEQMKFFAERGLISKSEAL
ncbi:hypothetical protein [Endozoicomonas lisbonensis]|uniref:hypothetical protein n=1 Tax=Endozoicomonas lisbonensis TaxID=3120522 RepID=UPI00339345EA